MPTLNWIGKEAVVKHHKEVPFRLLEPVPELSCGDADSGNLIVQGESDGDRLLSKSGLSTRQFSLALTMQENPRHLYPYNKYPFQMP